MPTWTLRTCTSSSGVIVMKVLFIYYYIVFLYFRDRHIFAAGKLKCLSQKECFVMWTTTYTLCLQGMGQKNAKSVLWYLSRLSFLRGWCCLRIIYESAVNFVDVDFELCLLCLRCFPLCLLSFFLSSKLIGNPQGF